MNKSLLRKGNRPVDVVPTRSGEVRGWQRWAPYAVVAWSMIYALLAGYWAVSGRGFPYAPEPGSINGGPLVGQLGPNGAWIVVMLVGVPAAALGVTMLRGVRGRRLRPLLIVSGALLAGTLLLCMTSINLLTLLGYVPYILFRLLTGADIGLYLQEVAKSRLAHQMLCVLGGFLWLGATVSYARRSSDACPYCGRQDGPEGWKSPDRAARWGRIAVYVSMAVPVVYAFTRYAWAVGFPLGMSMEHLRRGQETGEWISGLFLANVGLAGAILTLGLTQRWGEIFPGWMIGLAGRRVPMALALVPASIMSVLLMVGGLAVLPGYAQTAALAKASGQNMEIIVGPVALFPLWAVALAVATLGYYYRRRGPCGVCGRGVSGKVGGPFSSL